MRGPGIYSNVPIEEYHASEGISSSGINKILDCPKRYYYEYMVPKNADKVKEQNDKFKMGRAVHALSLEPEIFHKSFYVMDVEVDLRTKAGKEEYARAEHNAKGRDIIRRTEFQEIQDMSKSIMSHSLWTTFPRRMIEQSIFWDAGIFNTRLRARPDVYNEQLIVDIKTTDSIKAFANSIYQYGYHRQAAMQIDGLYHFDEQEREFAFFVVEKKAPYLTACFALDKDAIIQGRREYLDAAITYSECLNENKWPGYEEKFQLISIPSWAMKNEELI